MKKRITLTILAFLILADILETFTQYCFKKSAFTGINLNTTDLLQLPGFFLNQATNPFLWIGLISVIVTFIIWSTILSKIDLSVAVPVASFSYILVPLISIFFLHEKVGLLRWIGILFILSGVIFVSLTSKEEK